MKTLLTILLSVCFINLFGQSLDDNKYRLSSSVFKSDLYKPDIYQKFDGEIKKVSNDFYKFGDKTLKVILEDTTISEIFKRGIFNPDLVFGKETTNKSQSELDSLAQNQKVLYNLIRNDSLAICCFEELERLNPNAQTRRFKFWVFRIGVANPTEYYLELQDDKATHATTLKEFLENSTMTFFYRGTLII